MEDQRRAQKAGERGVLDRAYCFGIKTLVRDRCDVRVAQNFNPSFGVRMAQRLQRRQCQNEIAKRAAANDEDAFNSE